MKVKVDSSNSIETKTMHKYLYKLEKNEVRLVEALDLNMNWFYFSKIGNDVRVHIRTDWQDRFINEFEIDFNKVHDLVNELIVVAMNYKDSDGEFIKIFAWDDIIDDLSRNCFRY